MWPAKMASPARQTSSELNMPLPSANMVTSGEPKPAAASALKLSADFPRAYRNRASAYLAKGEPAKAVADCDAALKFDPQYARAYLTRSKAYAKLGKNAESQDDYQRAVKLDPSLK